MQLGQLNKNYNNFFTLFTVYWLIAYFTSITIMEHKQSFFLSSQEHKLYFVSLKVNWTPTFGTTPLTTLKHHFKRFKQYNSTCGDPTVAIIN